MSKSCLCEKVSENDQSAYLGSYLKLSIEFYNYGKGLLYENTNLVPKLECCPYWVGGK